MRKVRRPRALAAGLAALLISQPGPRGRPGRRPVTAGQTAATTSVPVQLVSITDFHGYLRPPSPADGGTIAGPDGTTQVVGGAAYLATHLKTIRAGQAELDLLRRR